jgi:glycosyltransferase involved in cell wall biosynthesis
MCAKLSVLMPVYKDESATFLRESLESLVAQTLPADEIVIVEDGPIGADVRNVIAEYCARLPIEIVELPLHKGLGVALRIGVERCRFNVIARMDADDICLPDRFERQLKFLIGHPNVDVLSTAVREFDRDPALSFSERRLPITHDAIADWAKRRNPVNHMTVMFRKNAVLAAGNYQVASGFEDYSLWVRMLMNGAQFHNLEEPLVFARTGHGMQKRRGGVAYLCRELQLLQSFRQMGFLTHFELFANILARVPVRLLPVFIRARIYGTFLRNCSLPSPPPAVINPQLHPPENNN